MVHYRQMTKLLYGLHGVACIMDDILVYRKNLHEHDKRLDEVMTRLEEAGMTLNWSECIFSKNEATFLGHRVPDTVLLLIHKK